MKRVFQSAALAFVFALSPIAHANPADASLLQKEYQTAMEKWSLELQLADTHDARAAAAAKRPDSHSFAERMWALIQPSLNEEWTIEPAAWFLSLTSSLPPGPAGNFTAQGAEIRKAIETWHVASPKLTSMCYALTSGADPASLALLEKIERTNPDKKIQGVAALAAAMVLKSSGETPELMARRLTYIRKAIIESAEVEINGVPVAKIADDELYIIRYLTKGRVAPDLNGVTSGSVPMNLSQYQGKIIVLIFWNSSTQDAARLVEFANVLDEKYRDRGVVVLGVNNDPREKLRDFQADGTVKFQNFSDPENKLAAEYRIGSWPLSYVLDAGRRVAFAGAPGSFTEFAVDALLTPQGKPDAR
jgi:peroxiredoxin